MNEQIKLILERHLKLLEDEARRTPDDRDINKRRAIKKLKKILKEG